MFWVLMKIHWLIKNKKKEVVPIHTRVWARPMKDIQINKIQPLLSINL